MRGGGSLKAAWDFRGDHACMEKLKEVSMSSREMRGGRLFRSGSKGRGQKRPCLKARGPCKNHDSGLGRKAGKKGESGVQEHKHCQSGRGEMTNVYRGRHPGKILNAKKLPKNPLGRGVENGHRGGVK